MASRALSRLPPSVMAASTWAAVPLGPPDPILGLVEAFKADEDPRKVSLSVGAYRTDEGKPWVLPSILEAEKRVLAKGADKEYLPITGLAPYIALAREFAMGADSPSIKENRCASVQTLSGTGACRVIAEFYTKFLGEHFADGKVPMYLPKPSWGNHAKIFATAGMDVRSYRYWDANTLGLDLEGMLEDLAHAPDGSAVLLHACAHNPTGVDPTKEQWDIISATLKQKKLAIFIDSAYQGFASGDAEADAYAMRKLEADGHNYALSQSFAKNFGLYGERVGTLSMICASPEEAKRVESQLKLIIRPMYSSPPLAGARIVQEVLGDAALCAQWRSECAIMANRIIDMRIALKEALVKVGSSKNWDHITNQIGMFCFSGMTPDQVLKLKEEHHIYITGDGRISMAGVTTSNVDYIAKAIHAVTSA